MGSFQKDEDLEEKLKTDPRELDFRTLSKVQTYKSRKLQARRDSGESGDSPDWWPDEQAPETLKELAEKAEEL